MHTYTRIHLQTHICIYTYTDKYIRAHTYTWIITISVHTLYTHTRINTCHAYPHACVHMYIHTYMPAYRRTDMYRRTDGHAVLAAAGPIHRFHLFSEPLASRFDQTRLAAIPEAMPTRSCTSQEAQLRRRGGHKVGSQNKGCFGTHSLLPLALALSGLPAME